MLSLTKKTEYALIAVCHLARSQREVVSARDIAARSAVRLPLLMNVLKALNQSGLLASVRGARGGYRLAVPAKTITLAALIAAVEMPVRLVRCAPPRVAARPRCELSESCPIRAPVHKLHGMLNNLLTQVTVADFAFDAGYSDAGQALKAVGK
ncbi:MAG TPA: Rrf2 family transcriptional regulator [Phycisphaerae bacterium]|nr:Rrf2 family transcriptional regulator [Phycisphaerae bacterium]